MIGEGWEHLGIPRQGGFKYVFGPPPPTLTEDFRTSEKKPAAGEKFLDPFFQKFVGFLRFYLKN